MAVKISKNRMDMGSTPIKNVSYLDVDQVATQAAPATGKTRFYSKTDGALYVVPAAGAETAVSSSIPANLVAHTTDTTAPSGWAEYTAGRGRVIVGTVATTPTHGGTVGTALTDLQNPTHTHTGPSHQHLTGMGEGWDTANVFAFYKPYGVYGALDHSSANTKASTTAGGVTGAYDYYTNSAGTGATGATSATTPYIQQLGIIKS